MHSVSCYYSAILKNAQRLCKAKRHTAR